MPLTKDDLEAVKALAKAGRIEEARTLLASIDGERAQAALAKFNERYPAVEIPKAASETPKTKLDSKQHNYVMWGILVAVLMIAGAALAWQIPAVKFAVYNASSRLYSVCLRTTWDRYGYDHDVYGCSLAVGRAMDVSAEEIIYCLESNGQTDNRLDACLESENVIIVSLG